MERPRIRTKYIKLGGPKEKCVGYCYYHKTGLTARQLKAKKCLMKGCNALRRWDHPYWEAREEQRARRAERKDRIERQYQEIIGGTT